MHVGFAKRITRLLIVYRYSDYDDFNRTKTVPLHYALDHPLA